MVGMGYRRKAHAQSGTVWAAGENRMVRIATVKRRQGEGCQRVSVEGGLSVITFLGSRVLRERQVIPRSSPPKKGEKMANGEVPVGLKRPCAHTTVPAAPPPPPPPPFSLSLPYEEDDDIRPRAAERFDGCAGFQRAA